MNSRQSSASIQEIAGLFTPHSIDESIELDLLDNTGTDVIEEQVSSPHRRSDVLQPLLQSLENVQTHPRGLLVEPLSRAAAQNSTSVTVPQPTHVPNHILEVSDVNAAGLSTQLKSHSTHSQSFPLSQRIKRVWFHWSTAYRLIIGLTLAFNLTLLSYVAQQDLSSPSLLVATSTNLLIAVLIRQEDLINASFNFVAKTPCTWPLSIRKVIADLHHYGGLHIGCSVSSLFWYCVFVAGNTLSCIQKVKSSSMSPWLWADMATCYAFMFCLIFVCITAHPHLRARFHNTFEHTHRFGGWLALLVLWINSGVASRSSHHITPLYKTTPIYLLAITTFLVILPWLRIRRISVTSEVISAREVKLSFTYYNMAYTSTAKFSRSPLLEWHAFATLPSTGRTSTSILISQAGDWTRSIVSSPPSHLWMRNPPAQNFLAFAALFKSVLLVATGAGIGPVLSLLSSPAIRQMRGQGRLVKVMWVVYGPDEPHWQFVQDIIRAVDSDPIIYDSKRYRPDVVFEAKYLARMRTIEAVMVVSNKTVTQNVVEGVKEQGGAAYGAVFDS